MKTPGDLRLTDFVIRRALRLLLQQVHAAEHALIIDELGLCHGVGRIDMAVVNGDVSGYEIKGATDNLSRLRNQQEIYSRVLDFVTVVAARRHVDEVLLRVPRWWGVKEARWDSESMAVRLDEVRPSARNPEIDVFAVAQLLWRDEALQILQLHTKASGVGSKPRRVLLEAIAALLPADEVRLLVREALKSRAYWRDREQPWSSDDWFQPAAMSLRSRVRRHPGNTRR